MLFKVRSGWRTEWKSEKDINIRRGENVCESSNDILNYEVRKIKRVKIYVLFK